MSFDLVVLGSSGSGPSPGNPASGYLLQHRNGDGGTNVWLEAGTGSFMALAEHLDPTDVDAVVVSHMHPDHSIDLFGLAQYLAHRIKVEVPTRVFLPRGGAARLAAYFEGSGASTLGSLDIDEVRPGDHRTVGAFELRFAATTHPVPTVAVRVEVDGKVMAYSADTGPGGGFPALAVGVDVLVCEAGLGEGRRPGDYPYHLDATEAGRLADSAGARRLVLTHLAPTLTPEQAIAAAVAVYPGPVDVARPGLRIAI